MNGFNFNIVVESQSFSPDSLMQSYARQHPSTGFGYASDGTAFLEIANTRFYFDRCSVRSLSKYSQIVTVYLVDLVPASMLNSDGFWNDAENGGAV